MTMAETYSGKFSTSSETQGQSVGLGEKAGRSFQLRAKEPLGTYSILTELFPKIQAMPSPDWAQKMLCIIVPNRPTVSSEFFSWVRTRRLFVRFFHQACACKGNFSTFLTTNERTTGSFARTWKLSSRLFTRPDWLPLGLRGCVN